MRLRLSILTFFVFLAPVTVFAHVPVRETSEEPQGLSDIPEIGDPTKQSLAVYGALNSPGQVDAYQFLVHQDDQIPVEVLVPVRVTNREFHPTVIVVGPNFPNSVEGVPGEVVIPPGNGAVVIEPPTVDERDTFFEPFSQERLYHGTERLIEVQQGQWYIVYVYNEQGQAGDYSLGIGSVENFEDVSMVGVLKEVFLIKFGALGGTEVPVSQVLALFVLLAGFIIGLGAVTVIDIHGFLGRTSSYWTEATIRTHKVTKPLIWIGIGLVIIGSLMLYAPIGWTGLAPLKTLIILVLIVNGLWLSFYVSPRLLKQEKEKKSKKLLPQTLQRGIALSFVISFVGWWSLLFLYVWYLMILY